jgi:glycosyltransferase involved in cell wall biosynthesis
LTALEAMAFGKPTLCYIIPSSVSQYPTDLPLINASQDNLADVLRELLEDGYRRYETGRKSRAYVEKYHDAHNLARELVDIYEDISDKARFRKRGTRRKKNI